MGATLAMAALVVTLLAVSFAGAPAQAREAQPTPEACDPDPADVVVRGSVALFDVYWDTTTETLNNNPCPPAVMHRDVIKTTMDDFGGITTTTIEVTDRSPSNVDIGHTVVHIRDLAKHDLVRDDNNPRGRDNGVLAVPGDSLLWKAYPDEETDRKVWFLPVFESEEQEHMHEEAFHLGFSAGLLRDADWDGDVQYDFEVFREPKVAPGDRGVIMVAENNLFNQSAVDWNSRDPDQKSISVAPGEYKHRAWAFTRPGTYVLSVQAKARPTISGLGDDSVQALPARLGTTPSTWVCWRTWQSR